MNEKWLLQLVLEALTRCEPEFEDDPKTYGMWADAMTALRQRLEKPFKKPLPHQKMEWIYYQSFVPDLLDPKFKDEREREHFYAVRKEAAIELARLVEKAHGIE